jgi:hypothetical protein
MADSLSKKLEAERINGNLLRIKIVRGVKSLNHSQFADDTLLLGGASIIISTRFNQVLESFLLTSEGAINYQKCQIFGWNANNQVMHSIYRTLQFSLSENWSSFKYLGIPIALKNPSSQS